MNSNSAPGTIVEDAVSLGTRVGRVRWTICAMLFVATSINYMDRQVLSILNETDRRARNRHDRG
jgi:ACS family hexuronate transporter-like MFS transporter